MCQSTFATTYKQYYLLTLAALLLLVAKSSYSHTPYLLPSRFEPLDNGLVTLDAAFAEQFFVPDVVFDNDDFFLVDPNGKTATPNIIHQLKSRTVLEHTLEQDGTYRFSTGRRYGAIFTTYQQAGETLSSRDPNFKLPNDAKLIEQFQAVTLAETYVTKGAPSKQSLQSRGQGLEIVPYTHPNELFVGDEFSFQLLFNGKPLEGALVEFFRARYQFGADQADAQIITTTEGMASFTPGDEGVYLIQIRHKAPAPSSAPASLYSNTYTLVIEAIN